ncbi:MAG: class I SAM-dependent methyltransferase [Anaerocolumna sp.]
MYNETINVAEIMRKLKAEIIPEEEITFSNNTPKVLIETVNEVNRIHTFLINTRYDIDKHIDIGNKIPDYNRFNWILKNFLRVLTRLIAKATRFITREQAIVNSDVSNSLKAVVESEQQMMKSISFMQELINDYRQLEKKHTEILNKYSELSNKYSELDKMVKDNNGLNIDNKVYLDFEDAFRGTIDEITRRLSYYFSDFILNGVSKDSPKLIIDIGCGRGEWLELLKSNGYEAIGIDINDSMVKACSDKGLHVILADAITYIKGIPNNSVKLLTAFQVIEHINFNQLNELLNEIVRVLDKGGMLILETPNPLNLEVGSCNFYNDPTHKRPVHPLLLEFLIKEHGINDTQIAYWKEEECNNWWSTIVQNEDTEIFKSPAFRTVSETVRKSMYNSPDYALIAIK